MLTPQLSASTPSTSDGEINSTSFTAGTRAVSNNNFFIPSKSIWVIDSGASRHICANRPLFGKLRKMENSIVTLPNHTIIPILFCGDIKLGEKLILKDVLYIPGFKFNLLSDSALTTNSSLVVLFSDPDFVIQDLRIKETIGKGKRWNNLYVLEVATLDATSPINFLVDKTLAQLWHDRLGHLSMQGLLILKNVLNFLDYNNNKPCFICPLAKQKSLPFVAHNSLAAKPFDLIHSDIWGPFHYPSHNGYKFFLTLVDDCTRFCWVYLIKGKNVRPRFHV